MDWDQALPAHSVLEGTYRITKVLGRGGFGLTYEAVDTGLNTAVAVKEYFPGDLAVRNGDTTVSANSSGSEDTFAWGRQKFLDEARTLAKFRHNNIVRVARLFEANNTAYMVLDFEAGPNLADWRRDLGRPPSNEEAESIATALCDAVEAVHAEGILHRDIKPANVIMRNGRTPVLIDFGAARQSIGSRSHTVHAVVTPGFSPKEQYALDVARQGTWTDVYALGATLYFIISGRAPADALARDLGRPFEVVPEQGARYSQGLIDGISAALIVDPDQRPRTVGELRRILFPDGAPRVRDSVHARRGEPSRAAPHEPDVTRPSRVQQTEVVAAPAYAAAARAADFDALPVSNAGPAEAPGATGVVRVLTGLAGVLIAAGAIWYYANVFAPARDDSAFATARLDNTITAYDRYLAAYPNGRHVSDAQDRRRSLQETPVARAPAPAPPPPQPAPAPPVTPPSEPPAQGRLPPSAPLPAQPPPPQPPIATPQPAPPVPVPDAPSTPPPTISPVTPVSQAPPLPERTTLPAALTPADLTRLQQAVTPKSLRLTIPLFTGNNIAGYTDQPGTFAIELARISSNKINIVALANSATARSAEALRDATAASDLAVWHSPFLGARRNRAYAVFAGLPFGLTPAQHDAWLRSEGTNLLEHLYWRDGINFRVIPCGIASGPGAWFKREILSAADFRNLKAEGYFPVSEVLDRMGSQRVTIDARTDRLLEALGNNSLEAFLARTPFAATFIRRPPPASILHYPSWHQASLAIELMVPAHLWLGLDQPAKDLIDEACRLNVQRWIPASVTSHRATVDRARAAGITVKPFPGPVLTALRTATDQVLTAEAAANPDFSAALASHNKFRR